MADRSQFSTDWTRLKSFGGINAKMSGISARKLKNINNRSEIDNQDWHLEMSGRPNCPQTIRQRKAKKVGSASFSNLEGPIGQVPTEGENHRQFLIWKVDFRFLVTRVSLVKDHKLTFLVLFSIEHTYEVLIKIPQDSTNVYYINMICIVQVVSTNLLTKLYLLKKISTKLH